MRRRLCLIALSAVLSTLVFAVPAAASTGTAPLAQVTGVGVHNAYDKATFPYLADALDSGASLIELDVWVDTIFHRWHVSHDNPFGNDNNCAAATTAAQLRTGARDQDLAGCLDDLRIWGAAHPGHQPVVVKVEFKAGFNATAGYGPAAFDQLVAGKLGGSVFRPSDLLGGYPTLDAAAQADNWPSRAGLAGKFLFELIPGTVEQSNPFDHLWTDTEYAQYLRGLAAAGQLARAQSLPSVFNAAGGDPRTRYPDTTLRPWFVFFDGDASAYVGGGIDASWYDNHHYFLVMTAAEGVSPALDDRNPTLAQAQARVAQLAAAHASIVSCDWSSLPSVLAEVLPRGTDQV